MNGLPNRTALWLIFASQALFLISSWIEPPATPLMIALRIVLPLIIIVYIGLVLAGFISNRKS